MATMYTIDINRRMYTVFFIVLAISAVVALVLDRAIPYSPRTVALASLAFFLMFFWLFDAILWRLPVIRLLNNGMPYIAGTWRGNLSRMENNNEVQIPASVEIKQSWSKIGVTLSTPEAVSQNTMLGMQLSNPDNIIVTWVYLKEGTSAKSLLESGKGIIEATLNRNGNEASLAGPFYAAQTESFLHVEKKE